MKRGYIKPIFLIVPNAKGSSVKVDTLNDGELSTFYQECKSAEESRAFIQNPNIIERQIGDEWLLNDPHHALEIEVRNFVYEYLYNHLLFEVKQGQ